MSYLENVNSPKDIKKLNIAELAALCDEIRELMIETVSKNGGHLASNLGAVELTVAMHKVFNSPSDQFVFDDGHQCYTHKILTGRKDSFSTLRTEGGSADLPVLAKVITIFFHQDIRQPRFQPLSVLQRQRLSTATKAKLLPLSVTVR